MQHVNGVDVSGYQDPVDMAKVKSAGYSFMYAKVTEGTGYVEPTYATRKADAAQTGMLLGAYHFMHWDEDPILQANFFLEHAGNQKGQLRPMIDCEIPAAGMNGVPAGIVNSCIRKFSLQIASKLNVWPIIYTFPSFWTEHMASTNWFTHQPLWIAHFGAKGPDSLGQWHPTFWQYADDGKVDGIAGNVDLDWFLGTLDQLEALRLA